ncbi:MAG: DUF4062 domain-containing protein [Desulfobacterales bacterium]|nr:DUF4062 domain-containing protein [Desulfobacterales bacterium]
MTKRRVFVSSVQKELDNERQAVLALVSTDLFLQNHFETVLYELEPAAPEKGWHECLATLDTCDIYLIILWKEYGHLEGTLSITHHEYRHAKRKGMPILVYIKGVAELNREDKTTRFLQEIQKDGFKYKRFGNFLELQRDVRASLLRLLKQEYGVEPSSDENEIAEQTIKATSDFENQTLTRLRWDDVNHEVAQKLVAAAEQKPIEDLSHEDILRNLIIRGLLWVDTETRDHYTTAAGIVLLSFDPSAVFPHCRFLADAYSGTVPDGAPNDQEDIRAPLPFAIERVISFIDRNTRHPVRVVGLNRIRLDEYPIEALREALVNAGVHRDYEDRSRRIMVEKFSDRIVISSPGLPPPPLTLPKLRAGNYKPCSRNPILAQCLSFFHRIEERGSGFRRMREQMLNHGLDQPRLATDSGYFQVILPGPGEDLNRLRIPAGVAGQIVPPSVEQQLNDRQKKIIGQVLQEGFVTSGWCRKQFRVTYDTANRDLGKLSILGILERKGKGRSTKYVLRVRK